MSSYPMIFTGLEFTATLMRSEPDHPSGSHLRVKIESRTTKMDDVGELTPAVSTSISIYQLRDLIDVLIDVREARDRIRREEEPPEPPEPTVESLQAEMAGIMCHYCLSNHSARTTDQGRRICADCIEGGMLDGPKESP